MVTNGPMESAVPSWRRAQPRLTVGGKTRHLDASSDSEKSRSGLVPINRLRSGNPHESSS